MKKLFPLLSLIFLLLLGCGAGVSLQDPSNVVLRKSHQPEVRTTFSQGGKLYTSIDDEDWILTIDATTLLGRSVQTIYVDKQTYQNAVIGKPLTYVGLYSYDDPDIIEPANK